MKYNFDKRRVKELVDNKGEMRPGIEVACWGYFKKDKKTYEVTVAEHWYDWDELSYKEKSELEKSRKVEIIKKCNRKVEEYLNK